MTLSVALHRKIVDFLISLPNVKDSSGRQTLIQRAALDAQLQSQMRFSEPPAQFFELLVPQLIQYGQLEDRRSALKAVLEAAKDYVGRDRREYCDSLIQQLRAGSNGEEHPPSSDIRLSVQLSLEGNIQDLNETKRQVLINVLATILEIERSSIRISHVTPARSFHVIITLPADAALEFVALFKANSKKLVPLLHQFSVKSINIIEGEELGQLLPHQLDTPIRDKQPIKVLQLEISREGNNLSISAYEQLVDEKQTLRTYEKTRVSMEQIEPRCNEIVETLNRVSRKSNPSAEVLFTLRRIGNELYNILFTKNVKQALQKTDAEYLSVNIDDQLVHIPWELLHTGQKFLCQRFNMGRFVKTQQKLYDVRYRKLERPLKMLALANYDSELGGARKEVIRLQELADRHKEMLALSQHFYDATPEFVTDKIGNFDIVHFAGHAIYDAQSPKESRWCLSGGALTAFEIKWMGRNVVMPALVFSNACQSARTETWRVDEQYQDEIFGLANAFLLSGVKHYIGTFWKIQDEPSSLFAREFYTFLLKGCSIGKASRLAREALIKKYGEENLVWTSYILYGDPTTTYIEMKKPNPDEEPPSKRPLPEVIDKREVLHPVNNTDLKEPKEFLLLSKALDMFFDEGRMILQEIRERRGSDMLSSVVADDMDVIWTKEAALRQKIDEKAWSNAEKRMKHLLGLLETYIQNYNLAQKQYAKWEELAPAIIVHRLNDAENGIVETIEKLQGILSKIYGKMVVISSVD